MDVALHPITSVHDPHLIPALRIYQEAFPVHEQMSVAFWFETVLSLPQPGTQFYAAVDRETGETLGMALYRTPGMAGEVPPPEPVAFLYYLCVRGDRRGEGLGATVYQDLVRSLFRTGYAAMVFEVEKPEEARRHGEAAGEVAERRVRWYQRNGARLLRGVDYLQTVDTGLPGTPMHVMIHTPNAVTPETAYALACSGLEEDLRRTSELALE
jgi:ribosomal protein S18 acetylase RimI-like enzyme